MQKYYKTIDLPIYCITMSQKGKETAPAVSKDTRNTDLHIEEIKNRYSRGHIHKLPTY
jgi:hypothetical protein